MTSTPIISVTDLGKTYTVPEREAGVKAAMASLFNRQTRDVKAVQGVSFEIAPGEVVGFLGPNGAGKTTTLKMLSGLLHPTSGNASVLGFTPWQRDRAYLAQMALIMGQRNQLQWDIPVIDSYQLFKAIFRIDEADYNQRLNELVDWLQLQDLIRKPARNLSLGERMKCEIAGSLLHQPKVLFLDEPTIGLDVSMQRKIREFIAEYNRRTGAAVMLTSHYMADIEALCQRVIVIHHGTLLYDGDLPGLVSRFSPHKTIAVEFSEPLDAEGRQAADAGRYGEVVSLSETRLEIRIPKAKTAAVASALLADLPIEDLTISEPPIEEVIEHVFATGESS